MNQIPSEPTFWGQFRHTGNTDDMQELVKAQHRKTPKTAGKKLQPNVVEDTRGGRAEVPRGKHPGTSVAPVGQSLLAAFPSKADIFVTHCSQGLDWDSS